VSDELGRMWRELMMAFSVVLSQYLLGGKRTHKTTVRLASLHAENRI